MEKQRLEYVVSAIVLRKSCTIRLSPLTYRDGKRGRVVVSFATSKNQRWCGLANHDGINVSTTGYYNGDAGADNHKAWLLGTRLLPFFSFCDWKHIARTQHLSLLLTQSLSSSLFSSEKTWFF